MPEEPTGAGELDERVESIETRIDRLEGRVESAEAAVDGIDGPIDEEIADLRSRILDVLERTVGSADKDHEHPAIDERLDAIEATLEESKDAASAIETRLDGLEDRVESGEEEPQSPEALADVERKLTTLANATVRLQRRADRLEADRARREAVAEIRREANRHGVAEATCENCEGAVRIALLSRPACPHCEARLEGVDPRSGRFGGWFGRHRLTTGTPPAIAGETIDRNAAEDGERNTNDDPMEELRDE